MVKIHEHQHTVSDPNNMQEREIEYFSWEKYVEDILSSPRKQDIPYPSLPRNSNISKVIELSDNKLVVHFYHFLHREEIEHVAKLMENK